MDHLSVFLDHHSPTLPFLLHVVKRMFLNCKCDLFRENVPKLLTITTSRELISGYNNTLHITMKNTGHEIKTDSLKHYKHIVTSFVPKRHITDLFEKKTKKCLYIWPPVRESPGTSFTDPLRSGQVHKV